MSNTRKEIFEKIYERCFKFGSCNYKETGCSDCPIHVTLVKAETLLDKQEQGLLIIAPCKVGDTIYLPWKYNGQIGIANLKVTKIVILKGIIRVFTDFVTDDEGFFEKFNGGMFGFSDFGEIVFLTEAEAEEALVKMGE